jgi:type I restriction enzyme S subunit
VSKWDIALKEIGTFQSGGTPSKSHTEYYNGNIPWVTTVALNDDYIGEKDATDFITELGVVNSATKVIPPNSILVGTRVGIGKTAINEVEMCANQDIISISHIDENIWDVGFLRKCIQSNTSYFKSQARGATIKGIKLDVLTGVTIPRLSKDEQNRVSSVINKVSELIRYTKHQLICFDSLVKSRFPFYNRMAVVS